MGLDRRIFDSGAGLSVVDRQNLETASLVGRTTKEIAGRSGDIGFK